VKAIGKSRIIAIMSVIPERMRPTVGMKLIINRGQT
jgi:hypothetical protein